MDFRSALEAIFESFHTTKHWSSLQQSRLTPEDIDRDCCAELIRVQRERYESPQNSDRLEGYGWSSTKIQEHMKRFLKERIQEMCHVLRTGDPGVLQNKDEL